MVRFFLLSCVVIVSLVVGLSVLFLRLGGPGSGGVAGAGAGGLVQPQMVGWVYNIDRFLNPLPSPWVSVDVRVFAYGVGDGRFWDTELGRELRELSERPISVEASASLVSRMNNWHVHPEARAFDGSVWLEPLGGTALRTPSPFSFAREDWQRFRSTNRAFSGEVRSSLSMMTRLGEVDQHEAEVVFRHQISAAEHREPSEAAGLRVWVPIDAEDDEMVESERSVKIPSGRARWLVPSKSEELGLVLGFEHRGASPAGLLVTQVFAYADEPHVRETIAAALGRDAAWVEQGSDALEVDDLRALLVLLRPLLQSGHIVPVGLGRFSYSFSETEGAARSRSYQSGAFQKFPVNELILKPIERGGTRHTLSTHREEDGTRVWTPELQFVLGVSNGVEIGRSIRPALGSGEGVIVLGPEIPAEHRNGMELRVFATVRAAFSDEAGRP
ncbi:MAG: hypothetical protein EA378_12020 [Phycisphaerales bacterium]|nr:MAG: hypothetical protein EA378_12020 [Phycisphaerales bacterium]